MVVWWVEWDKIFASIACTEIGDRLTKSTYTCCPRRDLARHHQYSFGSRVDLKTFLDSVYHGESERNSFKVKNVWQNGKLCTFLERMRFFEKRHLSSISYFSTRREFLLKVKCRYSWSAAKTLSNHVKKVLKKLLLEVWIGRTLYWSKCYQYMQRILLSYSVEG